MFIDLGGGGEMLLKADFIWATSGRRLPGDGVLPNLSDETLSDWASVSLACGWDKFFWLGH
jgi:hypothetical protein